MTVFWPALAIGVVFLVIGILFWINADRVTGPMRDLQRTVNGEKMGRTMTPRNAKWGAGGLTVFGLACVVISFLNLKF